MGASHANLACSEVLLRRLEQLAKPALTAAAAASFLSTDACMLSLISSHVVPVCSPVPVLM